MEIILSILSLFEEHYQ